MAAAVCGTGGDQERGERERALLRITRASEVSLSSAAGSFLQRKIVKIKLKCLKCKERRRKGESLFQAINVYVFKHL